MLIGGDFRGVEVGEFNQSIQFSGGILGAALEFFIGYFVEVCGARATFLMVGQGLVSVQRYLEAKCEVSDVLFGGIWLCPWWDEAERVGQGWEDCYCGYFSVSA